MIAWFTALDPVASFFGVAGVVLTVLTYVMRSPVRLRRTAIATNIAMFTYGALTHSPPTLILHAVLLPLNWYRLWQLQRFRRRIAQAIEGDVVPDWSSFFERKKAFKDGEILFARGDPAAELYYLEIGEIELVDFGLSIRPGELVGEIAFFSDTHVRTSTAIARGEVRVRSLDREELLHLYQRDSVFGLYLVQLITARLVRDMEAVRSPLAAVLADGDRGAAGYDAADDTRRTK